ncbi:unnamed protein product [Eruca vesicaria subsp. sativa]|uniref:Uncharacterized protein n=1 Tax=Eruca vesicaria subsp. sativa TaxID=29727 RepID=A0ABC8M2Q6_ERUVS|nr:unnamed protein product [Eruca vesicaria subsp. sativa]
MGDPTEKMLEGYKREDEFMEKVSQCGGFDIEHLRGRPACFWAAEIAEDETAPKDIVLYARFGIHKYNMIEGTNLQLHGIEKYNVYRKVPYSIHHVTAVAKDPSAGGSLVTFQTSFYEEGFGVKRLSCFIARPKLGPHGNITLDEDDSPLTESEPTDKSSLPEWPGENAFEDKKHYYVVKKSEVRKNDWIRLYLELAFYTANLALPNLDLSKLVITKVAVYSSDESIVVPNERLTARNAIFYIKYKYCPHKSKARGCKRIRDRIAIIRRKLDKFSGDITLTFEGTCEWRRTFL